MTIGEVARKLGVSAHTLRYYEKIGLIRDVGRREGKRKYDQSDLRWLEFIARLKNTGMPLAEIEKYARLRYEGDATITERKEMLFSHRARLSQKIKELQMHYKALETKIQTYEQMERDYESIGAGARKPEKD